MFVAKPVRAVGVMTIVAAACAAHAASARVADAPPCHAVTAPSQAIGHPYGVPPRVDGMANRPNERSARVAVPLVQASSQGGFDWASAAIGAAAILSLTLLAAAGWATVRGRRTPRHRGRAA
jgi:hypothetical protein